jgi:hypothetical protein
MFHGNHGSQVVFVSYVAKVGILVLVLTSLDYTSLHYEDTAESGTEFRTTYLMKPVALFALLSAHLYC